MPGNFLRRPRQLWFRKALFQVHLWVGIVLCLYALAIGISGSVLVFEDELARLCHPRLMNAGGSAAITPERLSQAADNVRRAHPERQLESVYSPGVRGDNYIAYLAAVRAPYRYAFVNRSSGQLLGSFDEGEAWLDWVESLHFRLLSGATGALVNGIGAAALLVLCLSGVVIWWPGVKSWPRALRVDFRRSWPRINFDLHSALGFWTLGLLTIWALSGIYFTWPNAFVASVNRFSATPTSAPPKMQISSADARSAPPLTSLLHRALALEPGSQLEGVTFAEGGQPLAVMLARAEQGDFMHTTWLYFDPATGKQVGTWRRGDNRTAGDWFVWLMIPLHFGTYWGWAVKCLWALLGLVLPVLAITGVAMYWNRVLSKKWRLISRSAAL